MSTSISVILPVLNGARFIRSAIRSVIEQTLRPTELIVVVDPMSIDQSAEIATGFGAPVTAVTAKLRGGAPALNEGVAQATGEYLSFIDADDMWSHTKLAKQVAALDADPAMDLVFGHVGEFHDADGRIENAFEADVTRVFAGISKTAMLIRRPAFERVGGFNAGFTADFPEWYARALDCNLKSAMLDDVVSFRRIHETNTSKLRREQLFGDYLKIARARARKAGA